MLTRAQRGYLLALAGFLLLPVTMWAHAVLVRSTPADHAHVKPGRLTLSLTYNSRVDAAHSTLALLRPDGTRQTLTIDPHRDVNVLSAPADLGRPGDYQVQWQVLSVDGHITRGTLQLHVD